MRLLLDTHIFVWLLTGDARLASSLVTILRAPEHELWVSAASIWELALKFQTGKLPGAAPILQDPQAITTRMGAKLLSIAARHAVTAGTLTWSHRDPFDRMLVAQANVEQLRLVTEDASIRAFPTARLLTW
ncbi:type II toxin-antitoxin system VapC family toxin [Deinococcus sp.]|uniref:type II toxin-antitoxin system VapC family toxin n=1 Tax=Deinococcus sp. TaxID=47478 RepID=UPI003CC6A3E7